MFPGLGASVPSGREAKTCESSVTFIIEMRLMKDMDKYWKNVDSLFNSKDNRKVILLGYAVGLVLVAASIYKLYFRLSGHEDFSFGRISSLFLMLMVGISLVCFLFYRKKISIKIKFYLLCLIFACGGINMFLHPKVSRRIPSETYCQVVGIVGCLFFGGGGFWVLYNDYKWQRRRRDEEE